jgi:hypothetical protein
MYLRQPSQLCLPFISKKVNGLYVSKADKPVVFTLYKQEDKRTLCIVKGRQASCAYPLLRGGMQLCLPFISKKVSGHYVF